MWKIVTSLLSSPSYNWTGLVLQGPLAYTRINGVFDIKCTRHQTNEHWESVEKENVFNCNFNRKENAFLIDWRKWIKHFGMFISLIPVVLHYVTYVYVDFIFFTCIFNLFFSKPARAKERPPLKRFTAWSSIYYLYLCISNIYILDIIITYRILCIAVWYIGLRSVVLRGCIAHCLVCSSSCLSVSWAVNRGSVYGWKTCFHISVGENECFFFFFTINAFKVIDRLCMR